MEASGKFEAVRTFVFLQGPPTGFWSKLAVALANDGHRILKVNFSLADHLFWRAGNFQTFRGSFDTWERWFEKLLRDESVTDVLYFNDGFPYHRAAKRIALKNCIYPWCVEFGYLRPDWITLEPEGLNRRSRFPTLPAEIREVAKIGSDLDACIRFEHRFSTEAVHEVGFNLLQSLGYFYNPRFRSGKLLPPIIQYIGWLPKLLRKPVMNIEDSQILRSISAGNRKYALVAMQMDGDYEVRDSRFQNLQNFLEHVLLSFSRDAPEELNLIVKAHPLEGGWVNWQRKIVTMCQSLGIEQRVRYTESNNLEALLESSSGLVVLNSTSGLKALQLGTPVIALGEPIYDRVGLTHQGSLSSFWSIPDRTDQEFLADFLRALSVIQVKGSFYDLEGQRYAINEIRARLTDNGPCSAHAILR